jgi:hypothetical protein
MMLDDWYSVEMAAATACRRLGKVAVGAEPGLRNVIYWNRYGNGTDDAIEALGELQTPEALDILSDLASGALRRLDQTPERIIKACHAIAKFGPAGRRAMYALQKVYEIGSGNDAYNRGNERCKAAARDAILAVDPEAAKAMGIERKRE